MGIEEWDGLMSAADERWSRIDYITRQHVSFPDEPFNPRTVTARVYTSSKSMWGRRHPLAPVAFEARIFMMVDLACISSHGSMSPYLYLTPNQQLVRAVRVGQRRKFIYVQDPFSITDEDLARLELGVRGDNSLIEAEYEKAHTILLQEAERQWIHPFSA